MSVAAAQGTAVKVPVDTKSFDVNNNLVDLPNHRMVAPAAGTYLVSAKVTAGGAGVANLQAQVWKAGAAAVTGENSVGAQYSSVLSDGMQCAAGDAIELYALAGGAAATIVSGILTVTQVA